jgi:hypothetical protein
MARTAGQSSGDNQAQIDCPGCGETSVVWYATKRPEYCSDACKQRVYRARKRNSDTATTVTNFADDLPERTWGRGGKRLYNTVRTDALEYAIAQRAARRDYEGAQALYSLARSINAPIDQRYIDAATESAKKFLGLYEQGATDGR